MEPDREGDVQGARAPNDGIPGRTNSLPKRDRDSLVTVRLSEPPSLHINTAVSPSALPARKSSFPDYTYGPSDAMAETLEEDDDSDSEVFEPDTSAKRRPNLQDELAGDADDDGDDDPRSSSDSERVDWDRLQKTEDMELKAQNVRAQRRLLPCHRN